MEAVTVGLGVGRGGFGSAARPRRAPKASGRRGEGAVESEAVGGASAVGGSAGVVAEPSGTAAEARGSRRRPRAGARTSAGGRGALDIGAPLRQPRRGCENWSLHFSHVRTGTDARESVR
jgi:hypothetical protein